MSEKHQLEHASSSGADEVMLQVARNLIELHKSSETEKVGVLKYYGAIATAAVTAGAGVYRFAPENNGYRDEVVIFVLAMLVYFIGIVVLRKLVAIRRNEITLSIELGNTYRYFIESYSVLGDYLGKSFKLYETGTKRIEMRGSDFFSYLMLAIVNTTIAFLGFFFLVQAIEIGAGGNHDFGWMLLIVEAVLVSMNVWVFVRIVIKELQN